MDRKEARHHWRDSIKECWDHRCAYCNAIPIDDKSLTLDHVKPRSAGGQDLTSNLVPACAKCNADKGSEDYKKWFRKQDFYCPIREKEIDVWLQTGDRTVEEWWEIGIGDLEYCIEQIELRAERQHCQAA